MINQALIALSGRSASWPSIDHNYLLNNGTNTHIQIDTHINSTAGSHGILGNFIGTSDIQTLTNKTLDNTTNTITCDKITIINRNNNNKRSISS